MIFIFKNTTTTYYLLQSKSDLNTVDIEKLQWLFGNAEVLSEKSLSGTFIGPRQEMITPWSTNAVEITQNMGIEGVERIEAFHTTGTFDPMLNQKYTTLNADVFIIEKQPETILDIEDIRSYNQSEGLALSEEEVIYLESVSERLGRPLTDSEVFGFSQVNSEHCRHKIFNGQFIIDGEEKSETLFKLIKKTSQAHPGQIESAYKDNVAFIKGPKIEQFAPKTQNQADYFETKDIDSVISLKAETHNFPTTVEPFNGAATGSGGEIRDRMAGGQGSIPLAGTAVYMTSYPRLEKGKNWEENIEARDWLYQTPLDILIKASNGASDFGNKFGQPVICGSVLTFEHEENGETQGFDKVIMMAGGVGYGKLSDAQKKPLTKGDKIVVMGGDNYRIGMGGSAVSSVSTGEHSNAIELNAIQRSNPEMQKRVANALRALAESDNNPIVSVHDHGAGGHLNCLSELIEDIGGQINIDQLPVGDPTLSNKEIIGNESQERMGLAIAEKDIQGLKEIADRERAPLFVAGEATGDMKFIMKHKGNDKAAMDWSLNDMFGSAPKTILKDNTLKKPYQAVSANDANFEADLKQLLQLEAVACKDWLTNKVDRSVTGRVAKQQTCGEIQLPLNNVAVMALDFVNNKGIATSIGHAPIAAIANPAKGSQLAITKALTNLIWAPLTHGLDGVSLSANWMWPTKTDGERARLYEAVEAVSEYAIALGVNIPTGKDSLSMTQKYNNGKTVDSPGTVIVSTVGEVSDIRQTVTPDIKPVADSTLIYIPLSDGAFALDGSSYGQIKNTVGTNPASSPEANYFRKAFTGVQQLIKKGQVLAGHDVSAGGLITTLLEMHFPTTQSGASLDLSALGSSLSQIAFSESPALVIQVKTGASLAALEGIQTETIGTVNLDRTFTLKTGNQQIDLDINELRDTWFKTSYLLELHQTEESNATSRFKSYKKQALQYQFPAGWTGLLSDLGLNQKRKEQSGTKAAIIREKGVNGDREMAYALHLAGFDVKDIHMTDLISGREDLSEVNMIVFVGGFSNSDVLGSAKGWAGAFLYNEKANTALKNFYARPDTLSLGVCNGCQLMMELGLVFPEIENHPKMAHNASGKFESIFLDVTIPKNDSVMLGNLSDTRLGVWVAHGEGKFQLPQAESDYTVCMKFAHEAYPGNPNGSDHNVAGVYSKDGRHLAMMPHLERSLFPWNWAHYTEQAQEITPWIQAFVNAREWVEGHK
ncbi:phosphoribosylformylglycinamidine synthase [Reichenbachiella carrageenanivorans]|uniref:Phosphoribosylformylglycinamidine synthase n=1 Tax=Reichenbachiella carrageenanivorans TaxID=2979869 RepID=A0ABY6D032_9BACT|nr:phosphoribosylformylglycinamidine synthase [Reichenbachiella carrageenanivorans]UXX79521.1 phosphoribosylformylglycinamidine synthase [Reichenbachiella carrageenanivorans]